MRRRARRVGTAFVLASWLLVAVAAAAPDSVAVVLLRQVALTVVTAVAAAVVLAVAVRRGSPPGDGRAVWALLGLGLAGYAGGFTVQFWVSAGEGGGSWGLNLSDCSSLLLYPLAHAGLLTLTRRRAGRADSGSVLQGALVFCGCAAVVVVVVAVAYPSLLVGSVLGIVYALAYPVGGFTLLVTTLTGLSLAGGRTDRVWLLLVAGFALMTVGDGLYGVASVAGTFRYGTALDALYTAGPVFVALAALAAPNHQTAATRQWRAAAALPALATLTALGVLVLGTTSRVPRVAVATAAACIVLAVLRALQLFGQGRALERSREQARTDELTGLANRRALLEALDDAAHHRPGGAAATLELLLLDLDGFKEVNDSLGHAAGDALLALVARRLAQGAPGCVIARLGGDEFAVLLPRDPAHVGGGTGRLSIGRGPTLAAGLRAEVALPALVVGTRVAVGVSVGHATLTTGGPARSGAGNELLRRADTALYRAKETRSGCVTWLPEMDQGSRDRLALVSDLRTALLGREQVQAWYQPKTDPRTGEVLGYEALVRWRHPVRGLLLPAQFLPAAERVGLLPQLTQQVLSQAVAFLAELLAAGRRVHVAVNLGAPDLLDIDLPDSIATLLREAGVPARHLRLEITETVVMTDPDRIIATLRRLRDMGVGLSLDDYGTGLSSLGYLRVLPVDELKIDRSFVQDLLTDPACALIVESTIGLAHDLRLRVVAEGVEDQPTLEALAAAGCDTVQGFHTGRPEDPDTVRRGLPWLDRTAVLVPLQPGDPVAVAAPTSRRRPRDAADRQQAYDRRLPPRPASMLVRAQPQPLRGWVRGSSTGTTRARKVGGSSAPAAGSCSRSSRARLSRVRW